MRRWYGVDKRNEQGQQIVLVPEAKGDEHVLEITSTFYIAMFNSADVNIINEKLSGLIS